jgi:hypothetical protein
MRNLKNNSTDSRFFDDSHPLFGGKILAGKFWRENFGGKKQSYISMRNFIKDISRIDLISQRDLS